MLSVGEKAIDFTLDSTEGKFTLSEHTTDSPILLYFFPVINGRTCTDYISSMIERNEEFKELGVDIININHEPIDNHRAWIEHTGSPFVDLSDPELTVCKAYDVIVKKAKSESLIGKTNRALFLIDKDMMIRYAWCADMPSDTVPMGTLISEIKDALDI